MRNQIITQIIAPPQEINGGGGQDQEEKEEESSSSHSRPLVLGVSYRFALRPYGKRASSVAAWASIALDRLV